MKYCGFSPREITEKINNPIWIILWSQRTTKMIFAIIHYLAMDLGQKLLLQIYGLHSLSGKTFYRQI